MSDAIDPRYLDLFPHWLRSLGDDAAAVGEAVASAGGDDDAVRSLVGSLNYIFKSLDLIPDGVDDLGFLDDAFVLRVACALASAARPEVGTGAVQRLSDDAREVRAFLGADYARLEGYVQGLRKGAARGLTVDDILTGSDTRADFLRQVRAWASDYQSPSFTRDQKTLVKLRAFLNAKLP